MMENKKETMTKRADGEGKLPTKSLKSKGNLSIKVVRKIIRFKRKKKKTFYNSGNSNLQKKSNYINVMSLKFITWIKMDSEKNSSKFKNKIGFHFLFRALQSDYY